MPYSSSTTTISNNQKANLNHQTSSNQQENELDDSNLIKRSNSSANTAHPVFPPGYLNTILNKDDPEFPIIPESLPTTPGFEISNNSMFVNNPKLNFPNQQKPTKNLELLPLKSRTNSPILIDEESDHYNFHVIENDDDVPLVMTLNNPSMNFWRLIASCCWCFSGGISDGCVGALLPNIEAYYNISYSIVSLIWLGNCIGFILVALTSQIINKAFKFHKLIFIPAIIQTIQYAMISSGTKFPVIVIAYFFGGIALACGLANHNYYISRLDHSSVYLGFFHGSYGIGATIGPLIATIMVTKGIKWHFFFLVLLGVSLINCFFLFWAFKTSDLDFLPFDNQEEIIQDIDNNSDDDMIDSKKLPSDFTLAVKLLKTWLISLFVFFYQGAEVGYGSWFVTFLLDYRHGNQSSRYVASGFWLGITISRFLITPLGVKYLGNRRSILVLSTFVILFDIISWIVPSTIVAGVMASLVGFFLGPTYPLMIGLVSRILPRKVQVISMTIMTAFGSSGGALFPFLIGIMSQYFQTWILHPIFIGLIGLMVLVWIVLPNVERIDKSGNPKNIWERIW